MLAQEEDDFWFCIVRMATECVLYLETSATSLPSEEDWWSVRLPNEEDWWRINVNPFIIACAEMEGYFDFM